MSAIGWGRLVPLRLVGRPRAEALVERQLLQWSKMWLALVGGALEPVLYLLAIGVGVGGLVGDVTLADGATVPYGEFVAPALLAASAMNGAVFETFNVYYKLREGRQYDAVLSTPLEPTDLVAGELGWTVARGGVYAVLFLLAQAALGLVASPWALATVVVALFTAFGFGGITMAATTWLRSWHDFDWIQAVIAPLFLFSATFYPLDVLPPVARVLTQLSPLYHGVAAARDLALGHVGPSLLVHLGVLTAMGVIGIAICRRRFARILLS